LFIFQDGSDVTSRVQDPDNVNSAGNGQVEDQVIPEPSDLGTSKPLEARVGNLIGAPIPGEQAKAANVASAAKRNRRAVSGLRAPIYA
jgi:hypothetical protein